MTLYFKFLIIVFAIPFTSLAQNEDYIDEEKLRLGFSYQVGPEVFVLLFPPVKGTLDFFLDKKKSFYVGIDASANVFIALWGHAGIHSGYRIKGFSIESGVDLTILEVGKYVTLNPKLGYEFRFSKRKPALSIFTKVGPSLYLKKTEPDINDVSYPTISSIPLNIEIGVYIKIPLWKY